LSGPKLILSGPKLILSGPKLILSGPKLILPCNKLVQPRISLVQCYSKRANLRKCPLPDRSRVTEAFINPSFEACEAVINLCFQTYNSFIN
jgi:hypothetical protein